MTKRKKAAKKRPVKKRTKNPRRTARTAQPKTRSTSTARKRGSAKPRSKKTAAGYMRSARSLLEQSLGVKEGKLIATKKKPEKKKLMKEIQAIKAQIRKTVNF